jgi:DNA-binding NtrC family response regulator
MNEMPSGTTIAVLFVDDDPAVLRSIVRALRGSPFEVLAADGAADALAILRERHVDVLVSDIDMPEMTGLQLMKIVRREFPSTLRMLLTGAGSFARTLEAINEGEVFRFFSKPFDFELFQETMRGLVARIARLRRDGEVEARSGRRGELHRWIDGAFPGTLAFSRNEEGEVLVDTNAEDVALLDPRARR